MSVITTSISDLSDDSLEFVDDLEIPENIEKNLGGIKDIGQSLKFKMSMNSGLESLDARNFNKQFEFIYSKNRNRVDVAKNQTCKGLGLDKLKERARKKWEHKKAQVKYTDYQLDVNDLADNPTPTLNDAARIKCNEDRQQFNKDNNNIELIKIDSPTTSDRLRGKLAKVRQSIKAGTDRVTKSTNDVNSISRTKLFTKEELGILKKVKTAIRLNRSRNISKYKLGESEHKPLKDRIRHCGICLSLYTPNSLENVCEACINLSDSQQDLLFYVYSKLELPLMLLKIFEFTSIFGETTEEEIRIITLAIIKIAFKDNPNKRNLKAININDYDECGKVTPIKYLKNAVRKYIIQLKKSNKVKREQKAKQKKLKKEQKIQERKLKKLTKRLKKLKKNQNKVWTSPKN